MERTLIRQVLAAVLRVVGRVWVSSYFWQGTAHVIVTLRAAYRLRRRSGESRKARCDKTRGKRQREKIEVEKRDVFLTYWQLLSH